MPPTPAVAVAQNCRQVDFAETLAFLREADDVMIVSHLRPDADCVGSQVALALGLEQLGKRVWLYNSTGLMGKLAWVEGAERIRQTMPPWTPQATVYVDCAANHRVAANFVPVGRTLNIDHHITNECFAERNYIEADAAAVGEQAFRILKALGATITVPIASACYLAVMGDTGCFRFPNTNAATFRLAAELCEWGADPGLLAQYYYENRHMGELVLSGKAYSRLKLEAGGLLAWSELRKEDIATAGGDAAEPDGLVNELRGIDGVEVGLLFFEMPGGGVRAGLRGKGRVNCAAIAATCGGGGHFNASGCAMESVPFEEGRAKLLAEAIAACEAYARTLNGKR